ncbi:MAG TPA: UPF0179 family protein [Candidatus Nanoarchaeia archaeon]|nr:UPF0179 family protein [Candidatus Nanoarchaeia archaeon]
MDEDTTVTLIGIRMAKPGTEFIFRGKSLDCNGCKVKSTCMNLEKGGRYKVVRVRDAPSLECSIHDGGVKAVEVIKAPWTVMIESKKAFDGSTIVYETINCDEEACNSKKLCNNPGPIPGEKYTILTIKGEPEEKCPNGFALNIVEIK